MTEKFLSVVGDPIEHSLSPLIHSTAYKCLSLPWEYDRNKVGLGNLANFLTQNRKYSGLSVTMPLKNEAFELATFRSPEAEATKVVNTLCSIDGIWHGFNTDIFGLTQALSVIEVGQLRSAAILGSGATARSALLAVGSKFPGIEIKIFARNSESIRDIAATNGAIEVSSLAQFSGDQDLVINATPADLSKSIHGPRYWLNTSYANQQAGPTGAILISPLEMLIWQAIAQVRIFTSRDVTKALAGELEIVRRIRIALQTI